MMRDYGVYDYGLIIPDEIVEDVANKRTLEEHVENEPCRVKAKSSQQIFAGRF